MTELFKEALETIKFLKDYCESDDPGLEIGAPVIKKLEEAIKNGKWRGLTDEELWEVWNSHTEQPFPEWFVDFKRAYAVIAEKLKEKNT